MLIKDTLSTNFARLTVVPIILYFQIIKVVKINLKTTNNIKQKVLLQIFSENEKLDLLILVDMF